MDFGVTGFVGGIWRDHVVETNDLESGYVRKRHRYEGGIKSPVYAVPARGKVENCGVRGYDGAEQNGSTILKDFAQGMSAYEAARIM